MAIYFDIYILTSALLVWRLFLEMIYGTFSESSKMAPIKESKVFGTGVAAEPVYDGSNNSDDDSRQLSSQ